MRYRYTVARLDDTLTQGESVVLGVLAGGAGQWAVRLGSGARAVDLVGAGQAEAALEAVSALAERLAREGEPFLERALGSVYSGATLTAPASVEADSLDAALTRLADELGLDAAAADDGTADES